MDVMVTSYPENKRGFLQRFFTIKEKFLVEMGYTEIYKKLTAYIPKSNSMSLWRKI